MVNSCELQLAEVARRALREPNITQQIQRRKQNVTRFLRFIDLQALQLDAARRIRQIVYRLPFALLF